MRAEHARRRRRITLSILGLVALTAAGMALARSPLFALEDVTVTGVGAAQHAQVLAVAGIERGENLLAVDVHGISARVAALPWVRDVQVRRRPPALLEIDVTPRAPFAVVWIGPAAWTVDADGVVLAGGAPEGLVAIDAPSAVLPPVGRRTSDRAVRNALAVHHGLPQALRTRVDRYEAGSDRGLRFRLVEPSSATGGPEAGEPESPALPARTIWVRFGLAERVATKARVLELLLDQARDQARRSGEELPGDALPPGIAEIDVRAPDNPVLIPGDRPDHRPDHRPGDRRSAVRTGSPA